MRGNPRVLASESLRTVFSIDVSVLGREKPENGICSQFFCKTKKFPEIFETGQNGHKSVPQSGERRLAPAPPISTAWGGTPRRGAGEGLGGPRQVCAEVCGSAPDTGGAGAGWGQGPPELLDLRQISSHFSRFLANKRSCHPVAPNMLPDLPDLFGPSSHTPMTDRPDP